MSKYKFNKRAMSLIVSAMTLGIGFNSMAHPNDNLKLVQSEEQKTDYEPFTKKDYENAKEMNLLVYRLLDNSIVGWDMKPMMSADGKQYKCDRQVNVPLHPIVERSQTAWWIAKNRDIKCFYLPSIDNPEESYLIRCDYEGPGRIDCQYAICNKSRIMGNGNKPVAWALMNPLDDPKTPQNELDSEVVCRFPTKILEKFLPRIDGNEMDKVKSCKFAGYEEESSCCKYIIGGSLTIGAALCLYPFLLED